MQDFVGSNRTLCFAEHCDGGGDGSFFTTGATSTTSSCSIVYTGYYLYLRYNVTGKFSTVGVFFGYSRRVFLPHFTVQ